MLTKTMKLHKARGSISGGMAGTRLLAVGARKRRLQSLKMARGQLATHVLMCT